MIILEVSLLTLLKNYIMKTRFKWLFGFLFLASSIDSSAQVTLGGLSYSESFDGIGNGLPTGWSVRTGANASSLGAIQNFDATPTSWGTSSAGFRNLAAAEAPLVPDAALLIQQGSTDRAIGLRQTSNFADLASELPAFTCQLANTLGISDLVLNFKLMQGHQLPSPQRSVSWLVEYALGNTPNSWISIPSNPSSLVTTQGIWGTTNVVVNFGSELNNQSENVWIRIRAAGPSTGANSRPHTAIDDFVLSYANANLCNAPSVQATAILFDNISDNSVDLSWTSGNGQGRVVIVNTTNDFTAPDNFTNPNANTIYSGPGQQVVFNGSGSGPISITGLNHSTSYWFRIYEFCEPDRVYQTASATGNEAEVLTEVCVTNPGISEIIDCEPITWIDGITYSQSNNTATFTLTTNDGCDSLVTLNFTLTEFEAETLLQGTTLTAFPSNASYQWVNCDNNNEPISGADDVTFTPTSTGNYAVIVTLANCSLLSSCTLVTVSTNTLESNVQNDLTIYPNPTSSNTTISGLTSGSEILIYDTSGKVILTQIAETESVLLDLTGLKSGIYFLSVENKENFKMVSKLVLK